MPVLARVKIIFGGRKYRFTVAKDKLRKIIVAVGLGFFSVTVSKKVNDRIIFFLTVYIL